MIIGKRILKLVLCSAIILSVVCWQIGISAVQIDIEQDSSLTIYYSVQKSPVFDIQFKLFRVADISAAGKFTLSGDFKDYSVSLENLTNAGWTDLALTLSGYVSRDGIKPLESKRTDKNGKLTFSTKDTGLYLVTGGKHMSGNYTYTPEPFLVSLPSLDTNGAWYYDVTSEPKYSSEYYSPGNSDSTSYTQRGVVKVWNDSQDKNKKRPASIVVQLLRDGKVYDTVTLNEANNWRHTWASLNTIFTWTVVEKEVPDCYTVSIGRDGNDFTITNKYSAPNNPPNPNDSLNPNVPMGPNDPSNPNDPLNPNTTSNPNDPSNPNASSNLNYPSNPNASSNPNDPSNPNASSGLNDPSNPNAPSNPSASSVPGQSDDSSTQTLPQTGMLWWPVYMMYIFGFCVFVIGWRFYRKSDKNEKSA